MCKCRKKEVRRETEEQERRDFQRRVESLRERGIKDLKYLEWTFANDDRRYPAISDACRKYVDEWGRMRAGNIGLLFFGSVGTGKSFYASCIANALLEKCVPALVTNFPWILSQSSGWGDSRTELLNSLQAYAIVIIDDLGVERSTDFAVEQVYVVVDTLYRSGIPIIVTTNLTPAQIKTPNNLGYERIYDRILQNSIPIKMTGPSRRAELAAEKWSKYQSFLGL
jgi:DNA replication protein DnaC